MRVLHRAPGAALSAWVERLTVVESEAGATRWLLPEPGLVLGLRYRGGALELGDAPRLLPDASIAGVRNTARHMQTLPHSGIVLVTFRPGRAGAFFGEPLHELFGATVALDDLIPARQIELARERVAEASDDDARFAAVAQFLRTRSRPPRDRLVDAALDAIVDARGAVRVAALARDAGLSRDRFMKRFRHVAGASPKRLASIVRLRHAIARYRPGVSLAQVAAEAGYADQSHFTREFRAFTGAPPGRFFASVDHC